MLYILGHLLAIAIGVSLGLLGSGGSVLALPILGYMMGIPTKLAIATFVLLTNAISS